MIALTKLSSTRLQALVVWIGCLVTAASGLSLASAQAPERIVLEGRPVTLIQRDALPRIDNEFSRRYRFDSFDNPKLSELRQRFHLDEVIASGTNEFQQQLLLNDWTHRQFPRFGQPSTNCHGALAILNAIQAGHTFYCAHFAEVLVSTAASIGWVARPLALRRHQGVNKVGGSTEHSVTEIWSNQHRKWVMLDPTSNLYIERDGVPLNAWEIRQEWFYRDGTNLVFRVGAERRAYRKADLPIILGTYAGFGRLTVEPDELDKYGFIGYIPNTDLMNSGYDYAGMFITKDGLCDGTPWHTRILPANPGVDPYFPVGTTEISVRNSDDSQSTNRTSVRLRTLTPNFQHFEARVDGGQWRPQNETFEWQLHSGTNRLDARTINQFGIVGPMSTSEAIWLQP